MTVIEIVKKLSELKDLLKNLVSLLESMVIVMSSVVLMKYIWTRLRLYRGHST